MTPLGKDFLGQESFPFYKFGDSIYLKKIPTSIWIDYIIGRFASTGKEISRELSEKICLTVNNHSSYPTRFWRYGFAGSLYGKNP